jgi:hypothetical protein
VTDQVFVIKRGDRLPAFRARCLDGTTPVNLTTAGLNVKFIMREGGGTAVVDAAATVEDQSDPDTEGWVHYEWDADDTATVGDYDGEIEVTWPGALKQTFPASGHVHIFIVPDLG